MKSFFKAKSTNQKFIIDTPNKMSEIETLSPNIKIIQLNKPPLPFELAEVRILVSLSFDDIVKKVENNVVILKNFIHGSEIPRGSILCSVNDEDINTKPHADTLKYLKHWNDTPDLTTPGLELKFRIDPDYVSKLDISDQLEEAKNIGVDDVVQNIQSESNRYTLINAINANLSTQLPDAFVGLFCIIYGWNVEQCSALLQKLIDDYYCITKDLVQQHYQQRKYELSIEESDDSDLLSPKYALSASDTNSNPGDGKPTNISSSSPSSSLPSDYLVSLASRQLGMTIENVMERTVVRAIHANSDASKLGVKTNSVILNIGASSTLQLTHLETLEALKNTVRPVKLNFRRMDEKCLAQFRIQMQTLVQRKTTPNMTSMAILDLIDDRLVWILSMSAMMEALNAIQTMTTENLSVSKHLTKDFECSSEDQPTEIITANDPLNRSLQILSLLQSVIKIIADNKRREALVLMRCNSITEILACMLGLYNWGENDMSKEYALINNSLIQLSPQVIENILNDSQDGGSGGTGASGNGANPLQHTLNTVNRNMSISSDLKSFANQLSFNSISIVGSTLREVCYTLLQLQNDQQTDLQPDVRPDSSIYGLLANLYNCSLNSYMIQHNHIPNLWRLGGSSCVPARVACADLVPILYLNLTEIQKLRVRGLINRLLVDSIAVVRAHVMLFTCSRILRNIVEIPTPKEESKSAGNSSNNSNTSTAEGATFRNDKDTVFNDAHSATVNWIAHCVVQTSGDVDADVRKASLQACSRMIEYFALGLVEEEKRLDALKQDQSSSPSNSLRIETSSTLGKLCEI